MAKAKKWIIFIIVIAAVVVGAILYIRSKAPKTTYTTADVVRGNLKQTVSETGTIRTVNQTDLSFRMSGRVVNLMVDVGDQIQEGQLLARLDTGTLDAQLAQAKSDLRVQQDTLSNMLNHKSSQPSTPDSRNAQRARVDSARAQVDFVYSQIRDTFMYSPINGVILKRNVDPYETTVADSPTPVFTIGDPNDLVIETNVPESDIGKIKIGQNASLTFDALGADETFEASITEIDPAATTIQDVVYYQIDLKLGKNDPRVRSGMTANIDIATAEKDNVLMIPMRAVKTEGKKKYVEILQADNTTKKIDVETGAQGDEGMIEVKSGLKEGEKVVTFTQAK